MHPARAALRRPKRTKSCALRALHAALCLAGAAGLRRRPAGARARVGGLGPGPGAPDALPAGGQPVGRRGRGRAAGRLLRARRELGPGRARRAGAARRRHARLCLVCVRALLGALSALCLARARRCCARPQSLARLLSASRAWEGKGGGRAGAHFMHSVRLCWREQLWYKVQMRGGSGAVRGLRSARTRCGSGSRLADGHAAAAAAQACWRGAARAQGAARRQGRPVARQRVLGAVAASGDARALTRAAALAPLAPRVQPPLCTLPQASCVDLQAAPAPRAAAAGAPTAAACCLQAAHPPRLALCAPAMHMLERAGGLSQVGVNCRATWGTPKHAGSLVSAGARL